MGCQRVEDRENGEPPTLSIGLGMLLSNPDQAVLPLSPAPSGTTFPTFLPLSWCPGNRKQTWRAEGGLVRTGLVGKLLKQTHNRLSSAVCQLPHTSLATARKARQA